MTLPSADSVLNGLKLNSYYIPEEVLSLILSYVDPDSLVFHCRLVCKSWKNLIDEDVWKIRIRTAKQRSFSKLSLAKRITLKLPWYIYYSIFTNDPFERNLIKNHCGQEKMKYWFEFAERAMSMQQLMPVRQPRLGNGFWKIESVPSGGSDPLPQHDDFENCTSCFVTSYRLGRKYQIIDLKSHRILGKIMDECQPTITASEWYAGSYDCECEYQLTVSLLDGDKNTLQEKQSPIKVVKKWEGRAWEKVELIFEFYGPNVRYIKFRHEGKDTNCWSGHYGSKMSGAVVKISLPMPKASNFRSISPE